MRIGINATSTQDNPTGIHVYAAQVVKEMLKQSDNDLLVYTASTALKKAHGRSVKLVSSIVSPERGAKGLICRLAWCQTFLPAHLMADGIRTLYSTTEEGILCGQFQQVLTVYDILPLIYPEMYPVQKYSFRCLLPHMLRMSKAVICISENTKRDVITQYGMKDDRIFVAHCGVDHLTFRPLNTALAREKYGLDKFILYVGDMKPHKNLARALEAFSRLRLPEHKFVIVGKKFRKFYPQLEKKVRELHLRGKVLFTDYVPIEDLPYLYSAADVFVFPSLYEGFGMPPLEAMACGCPVVASRVASIPEVCGDAAYYVAPLNVESIAEGIYKVVTDSKLRKHLVAKGLERAKLYSWSRTASKVLQVLDEIAHHRLV